MNDLNKVIKGLWIGKELSPNEILCVNSYLKNNHEFELYIYKPIKNIPESVTIKDANQIIPKSEIFEYSKGLHKQSLAAFSDLFRFKLLYELGGWWSDMDAVCIKHYDFDQEYVFMQEKQEHAEDRVCNGVIKCPPNSQIMEFCYFSAKEKIKKLYNYKWAATGPMILNEAVHSFRLDEFILPTHFFSPIGYYEIIKLFTPFEIDSTTYSIHLYNEIWNMYNISKYGIYNKNSFLEKLKRKYSVKNKIYKLITELLLDLTNNKLSKAAEIIHNKLWYMVSTYENNIVL
jgi:mannosyltransferase OCH1-like enzyme